MIEVFELLNRKPWAIRGLLLPTGQADNCISTARIMASVLSEFDVTAIPCTARVIIATDLIFREYERLGHDVMKLVYEFDPGTLPQTGNHCLVTVGYPDYTGQADPGWAGHLINIAQVDGRWYLIDFSVDQANPFIIKKGLETFDPFVMDIGIGGGLFPEKTIKFRHGSFQVEYRLFPEDLSNETEQLANLGKAGVAILRQQEAAVTELIVEYIKGQLK